MKIEIPKQLEISNIAGDFESIEAGMDASSLPFILEMLSKNFYSNPIGSICREITSNCFDSHIEAKVDDAVVIKMETEDLDEYSISFCDYGVGLSPERIKKVYMKWFTSTKRDSNDQIGGFGLGSKTPLSYTDYFYITTNVNKIKYSYIFSKGESLPTLDLLSEEETDEKNGTEVKIPIKNFNDRMKFIQALKNQLCYFDNVYFIGCDIDNDYKIYETDLFKYRNKGQYSDYMHICFGKVSYPIDWEQIGLPMVKAAVGIKFDISELSVTPNREALRYTEEVKSLVKERVIQATQQLRDSYEDQKEVIEDFKEWYNKDNKNKYITFGDDICYLRDFDKLGKKYTLKIFKELNFDEKILGDDPFGKLYCIDKVISQGVILKKHYYGDNITRGIFQQSQSFYYSENSNYTNIKNYFHVGGKILKRLGKTESRENFQFSFNNRIERDKKNPFPDDYSPYYIELGIGMRIAKLIQYLRNQVESRVGKYHIDITDEQKKTYSEYLKSKNINLQRKIQGNVFCKGIVPYQDWDWNLQDVGKGKTRTMGIENFKGIVVYGFAKDKKLLDKAITFCYLNPKFRLWRKKYEYSDTMEDYGYINPRACKIIQIAQSNEKYFKNKKNMVHVTQLYSDNKLFRKLASSYRISSIFEDYLKNYSSMDNEVFIEEIKKINESVGANLEILYNYYLKFTTKEEIKRTNYERKDLRKEILDIATKHNLFDLTIEAKIKEVESYFNGIELLKHIEINDTTLPLILKYLKEKKKKINLEYYCRIVTPELQPEFDFEQKEVEMKTKFMIITNVA